MIKYMKEISETETYRAMTIICSKTLDKMESSMNVEQFQMVLEYEGMLMQMVKYINTEENKKMKAEPDLVSIF